MQLTPSSDSSEELLEHDGEEVAFVLEGKVNLLLDNSDDVKVIFAITPPSF